MKVKLEIRVTKIYVDSKEFSFRYDISLKGVLKIYNEEESGTHVWRTPKQQAKFKAILKNGYAYNLVLEHLNFEELL